MIQYKHIIDEYQIRLYSQLFMVMYIYVLGCHVDYVQYITLIRTPNLM